MNFLIFSSKELGVNIRTTQNNLTGFVSLTNRSPSDVNKILNDPTTTKINSIYDITDEDLKLFHEDRNIEILSVSEVLTRVFPLRKLLLYLKLYILFAAYLLGTWFLQLLYSDLEKVHVMPKIIANTSFIVSFCIITAMFIFWICLSFCPLVNHALTSLRLLLHSRKNS